MGNATPKMHYWFVFLLFILRGESGIIAQPKSFLYERYSPNYSVSLLTAKEGLSQGSSYYMYCDSRNFMWFSSYEGLNKYDGKHFKVYLPSKNDSTSIKGGVVYGITEDKLGNLWVGTEEGLNCFNRYTETFTMVMPPNKAFQQVHTFAADSSYVWYVGSVEGLVCYNFKAKTKQILNKDVTINNNYSQVFSACRSPNGDIWWSSSDYDRTGILRYNNQTQKIEYFFSKNKDNKFGEPCYIRTYYQDVFNPNVLWLGTEKGLLRFDINKHLAEFITCPFIDFKSSYINDIEQDAHGNIWLATNTDGLVLFSPQIKRFQKIQEDSPLNNSVNRYSVSALYSDIGKGIIWVNLEALGILKITPAKNLFRSFHNDPMNPTSLSFNNIRCFTQDKNKQVWIGTLGGGINLFDPKKHTFKRLPAMENNILIIPDDNILQLRKQGDHKIWMGTHNGLVLFDENTQKFQLFRNKTKNVNPFSANTVQEFVFLPDGQFLLNTDAELFLFNPVTTQFKPIKTYDNTTYHSMFFDAEKEVVYLGSDDDGFFTFKYHNETLVPIAHALKSHMIMCFLKHDNQIWVGTNKGLFVVDENYNVLKNYTVADGLPSNCIYGSLADKKGNIWFSSNQGLSCFNKTSQTFKNYTTRQGLQGYEYNIKGAFKSAEGDFYFGGVEGFDVFNPDSIVEQTHTFPTRILDLKINNEPFKTDTVISEKQGITLNYRQNTLQISFQALDYEGNGDNRYRFKLLPSDTAWHLTNDNTVIFAQLPPNNYTFIVEAASSTGNWTGEKTVLHIFIHPPFWNTWWFWLLAFIGFVGTIYYLGRLSKKRELKIFQKEQNFKRRLAETEMTALRSQMNPHFIFNVLNSINDYMLNHDSKAASQYLTDFSKLIRLVLENSRSEKVTLGNELAALELYMKFEQLRFEDKLQYEIELGEDIDTQFIKIPPLLIQPYIENAIWHGLMHRASGGKVTLRVKQIDENLLHIEVEDNGIGRAAAAELQSKSAMRKKSFGMTITSERIQLVNEMFNTNTQVSIQDLVDTEGGGCGTKVVIEISC